jgi:hypothetical protein
LRCATPAQEENSHRVAGQHREGHRLEPRQHEDQEPDRQEEEDLAPDARHRVGLERQDVAAADLGGRGLELLGEEGPRAGAVELQLLDPFGQRAEMAHQRVEGLPRGEQQPARPPVDQVVEEDGDGEEHHQDHHHRKR